MSKERIILLGAGQHARVVLYNAKQQGKYEVIGIIDKERNNVGRTFEGIDIIGTDDDLDEIREKYCLNKFFLGMGDMKVRQKMSEKLIQKDWQSVNIIHPDAIISENAQIGQGVLVECGCFVTPNPIIGNNVVINVGSQVNHDNVIGNNVYIASGVILSGGITIGENSLIDDGVIITLGKKVGSNCIIGAGSVVTKDIGDNIIAYGNPCKIIRGRDE